MVWSFFATGICGLFFLPFFVLSSILCHRRLCTVFLLVMAFSAVGIHVRLFGFALLVLFSGYQCISQVLVSRYALAARQLHPWEIRTGFFSRLVALQIPLWNWSKPHLVFHHKVYEIALCKVLTTQMGVTEAQHQSRLVSLNHWVVQIWPVFTSQRELVHSYALGCLWVVTVQCCNTVGQHG